MTIRAKTLVKDKFWIVEQDGQKLGTLQKQENNGVIQTKDQRRTSNVHEHQFNELLN